MQRYDAVLLIVIGICFGIIGHMAYEDLGVREQLLPGARARHARARPVAMVAAMDDAGPDMVALAQLDCAELEQRGEATAEVIWMNCPNDAAARRGDCLWHCRGIDGP